MPKKSSKILPMIFFFALSCAHVREPYMMSHLPNIQNLEKQDHQFCDSLKLNFDKRDNLKSSLYWRCRLSLAKYKLFTDTTIPENLKFNHEITDLIGKISLQLAETPESILLRENKIIDNRQHKQCLVMGFEIETEDQIKIDDYFACRKSLIESDNLVPAFGNLEYLNYPNHSYNVGFAIDMRIDEKIKKYNAAKEKYPTCIEFNLNSINFAKCKNAQNQSRQCFSEIETKKFKKEAAEKIICQKRAYIELPDKLLKDDDEQKKEITRMKKNSDFYNQNSFAALGITDITDFDADDERVIAMKIDQEKGEPKKNINSKEGLYGKFELTKLRQKYIYSCQKEADGRVAKYAEELKKSCEEMAEFEKISE